MDVREFKRYGVVPGLLIFEMEIKQGEGPPPGVEVSADGLTFFDRERMQLWVRPGGELRIAQAA
jgi:hypothetical protein